MKINLIIVIMFCLLGAGWMYASSQNPPQTPSYQNKHTNVRTLDDAVSFDYMTLDGATGNTQDHIRKPILLHFWASWCAPCIVEFPELIDLARTHQDDLVILAVSSDTNKNDIQKFLTGLKHEIPKNMKIIHDRDKIVTQDLYATFKLPETYLINPNFQIQKKYIGPQSEWDYTIWNNDIRPLLLTKTNQ